MAGYKDFTNGKFAESGAIVKSTLQSAMVARVDSKGELDELREQMSVCREYITAVLLESTRMEQFKEEPKRNLELAAYLTHFNLQPLHMLISLRSAMSSAVKLKNFNTAASFSHRLMKLNPKSEHKEQALKVLRVCDTNRTNEVDLTYDERNPFVVCTYSSPPSRRACAPPLPRGLGKGETGRSAGGGGCVLWQQVAARGAKTSAVPRSRARARALSPSPSLSLSLSLSLSASHCVCKT